MKKFLFFIAFYVAYDQLNYQPIVIVEEWEITATSLAVATTIEQIDGCSR